MRPDVPARLARQWATRCRRALRKVLVLLFGERLCDRRRGWVGLQRLVRSELSLRAADLAKSVSYEAQPARSVGGRFDRCAMRLCWIIPDFVPGSGGHMTIFRLASLLESFGHEVRLLVQNPSAHRNGDEARATINRHFQPFRGRVELFSAAPPQIEGDALIATDRFSCYPARAMSGFRRKFYLVQDYETQFYAMGAEALLAENTYRMGFDCLCAGEWLGGLMREKFGAWAMSWPLAYDSGAYFLDETAERPSDRIALYGRFMTERRAVELAIMALDLLHSRGERFHVDFFGCTVGRLKAAYSYTDHGVLTPGELGSLYRRATIGLVFSATNHSLVNKEMMACGLPVIDLDVPSVRAVFPDNVLHCAPPEPQAIADALQGLLSDAAARDTLRDAGLRHVEGLSWARSAQMVEQAIAERILTAGS